MSNDAQQRWLEQWRGAARALEAQKRTELRALSAERALAAIDNLLALASPSRLAEARRAHSGLVELQRLLRRRPPG